MKINPQLKMPLVLDFDGSVTPLPDAQVIDMSTWQDAIRFGCSFRVFHTLEHWLNQNMPSHYGPVLLGSGDFHHISNLLINRLGKANSAKPFQVVVLDNHPDNMRFPFGIHCGSWVSHVARLPFVSHVHVLGITSGDIGIKHAWENRLLPLYRGKLSYWCINVAVGWARRIGLSNAFHKFDSPDELITSFISTQYRHPCPTYLSIDKDVLSVDTVRTNWDQGLMRETHLIDLIAAMKGAIIGCDITGDISQWRYSSRWKRMLSSLDGQDDIVQPLQLASWQQQQRQLNQHLLKILGASMI